jgi:hypothetical protein
MVCHSEFIRTRGPAIPTGTMGSNMSASVIGGSRITTAGALDITAVKFHTLFSQAVYIWGVHQVVTIARQSVGPQLIQHNEKYVFLHHYNYLTRQINQC